MSVAHILAGKGNRVVTTTPDRTLHEVAQVMSSHSIGAIIVCGAKGEIVGILSERDIMRSVANQGVRALDERVSSHMTKNVSTSTPDTTVIMVMQKMTAGRFRHMPIVSDGELVGIVSIGDLIKHRLSELEGEQQALKEYIASA